MKKMEPFNVKVRTFPDASKQVKIYSKTFIPTAHVPPDREREPFHRTFAKVIKERTIEEHFDNVSQESLRRTKSKIYDYARCNQWEYFVTFTFSKDKVNRYDYSECTKKLSKWLNNLKSKNKDLKYVVVPERHKDGAFHFHGLFSGLNQKEIKYSGRNVIKRVKSENRSKFIKTSQQIFLFSSYKLGWMSATKVQSQERCCMYITKYITKDLCSVTFGKKRYWASRNLDVPFEETLYLDVTDRFILKGELTEEATYHKNLCAQRADFTQYVDIFELS